MLKLMRRKTLGRNFVLVIIIIALASYVLVSFGQAPPKAQGDTVTKIGDTTLKVKDIDIVLRTMRERFGQFDPDTLNQIVSSTVINDAIIKNSANELGIHVSDAELRDFVIKFRKNFSAEGEFVGNEEWANWIRYKYQMPVAGFETYLRENDLKVSHFRNLFNHAAVVTEQEVRQNFIEGSQLVDIDYAAVNTSRFRKDLDLSDKNIKKMYDADKESFKTGPLRKAQYVYFTNDKYNEEAVVTEEEIAAFYEERKDRPPYTNKERVNAKHILIKPVDGKKDVALARIKKVKTEIDAGLSFEDAAKRYSDDAGNAERGGDLGYATRDRWDPKFAEVAFSLEKDVISDPVESSFGFHLIKMIDKKPEVIKTLEEVKEQIEKQIRNRKGRELAREKAKEFQEKLQVSLDFEALAKEFGLEIGNTDFFDNDPQAIIDNTIQRNSNVSKQIFDLKNISDFSDNIDIGRGVVIAKWVEAQEPRAFDWEVDNIRIKAIIEERLANEYMNKAVAQMNEKAAAQPDATFKELATTVSFIEDKNIKELVGVSKSNPPSTVGAKDLTFETLYNESKGTVLAPIEGRYNRQYVFVFVKNKVEPDFNKFDEQKLELQNKLKQNKGMEMMANYIFAKRQTMDPGNQKQAIVHAMISRK